SSGGRRASRFPFPSHGLDSHEPTWDPCWRWGLSAGTACFKYRTPEPLSGRTSTVLRCPPARSHLRFPHAFRLSPKIHARFTLLETTFFYSGRHFIAAIRAPALARRS